jgi:DUF1365 family protein
MRSAIYEGTVRHRRHTDREHAFTYKVAMAYLDLSEVDTVLGGRLRKTGPGGLRFRRSDYFGDPNMPLDEAVRDRVAAETGRRVDGPIRLLTHLRSFGHSFNPASFYYCFDADDRLQAVLLEVTNTPWRESHTYVVAAGETDTVSGSADKQLHVSPFFGMNQQYAFSFRAPSETLFVHIDNLEDKVKAFDATLRLTRKPFDAATVRHMSWRYPLPSRRMLALIYAHAALLRLKGVKVHRHPQVTA